MTDLRTRAMASVHTLCYGIKTQLRHHTVRRQLPGKITYMCPLADENQSSFMARKTRAFFLIMTEMTVAYI